MAAIQVIVYAGAIVVLFLFVIAYLGERPVAEIGDRLGKYAVFAWIAVIALAVQGVVVLATTDLPGFRDDPKRGRGHRQPRGDRALVRGPVHRPVRGDLAGAAGRGGRRGAARQAGRPVGGGPVIGEAVNGVPLILYIGLSGALFLIGLLGVMIRRNPLLLLLAVELLLNSANLSLVAFSRYWSVTDGQVFALVVMVVAATEVVIGLGLVVAVFRQRMALDVNQMSTLKG